MNVRPSESREAGSGTVAQAARNRHAGVRKFKMMSRYLLAFMALKVCLSCATRVSLRAPVSARHAPDQGLGLPQIGHSAEYKAIAPHVYKRVAHRIVVLIGNGLGKYIPACDRYRQHPAPDEQYRAAVWHCPAHAATMSAPSITLCRTRCTVRGQRKIALRGCAGD